jgi:hypothetical protein
MRRRADGNLFANAATRAARCFTPSLPEQQSLSIISVSRRSLYKISYVAIKNNLLRNALVSSAEQRRGKN